MTEPFLEREELQVSTIALPSQSTERDGFYNQQRKEQWLPKLVYSAAASCQVGVSQLLRESLLHLKQTVRGTMSENLQMQSHFVHCHKQNERSVTSGSSYEQADLLDLLIVRLLCVPADVGVKPFHTTFTLGRGTHMINLGAC